MKNPLILALVLWLAAPGLSTLHAQVNDLCSSVTPEVLNSGETLTFTGDNTGATTTDDYVPGSLLAGFGIPVVWHAFTTTACSDLVIDYCGSPSVFVDFWNAVASTCPASNAITVTQLYDYTTCGDGNPTMRFNNLGAGTYYYPVWTAAGSAEGPYTIHVTANACGGSQPPVNDNCTSVTAELLAVDASLTFTGDNANATATGDFAAGSPFAGAPVVWHAFTTETCADVTVAYCGLDPVWANTFGILSRDCPASDLVYFSTFNDTACGDGNITYTFTSLLAGTYFLPVLLDPNDGAVGPYAIEVAALTCTAPPAYYDFCSQVIFQDLAAGSSLTLTGDNSNATPTGDFVGTSPFAGAPVVWHGFTTTVCTNITLTYCGLDPVWNNTFGFLGTACPVETPVFFSNFNTTACGDGNVTYVFTALPPGNYLVPVVRDEANDAIGPYSIDVTAVLCPNIPPPNDNCADVTPEALAVGGSLTLVGDNTNATATGDFVAGSPFEIAPVAWHAFTTIECADVRVAYCGLDPVWANTLGFLSTTCPGETLVFFNTFTDTLCTDTNVTYLFNDLPAGTYYVPVLKDAVNDAIGPYSLQVTATTCITTGLTTMELGAFTVMPNPSNGTVQIRCATSEPNVELAVMDMTGRIIHRSNLSTQAGELVPLELSGVLSTGAYLLRLSAPTWRSEQRLVIQ